MHHVTRDATVFFLSHFGFAKDSSTQHHIANNIKQQKRMNAKMVGIKCVNRQIRSMLRLRNQHHKGNKESVDNYQQWSYLFVVFRTLCVLFLFQTFSFEFSLLGCIFVYLVNANTNRNTCDCIRCRKAFKMACFWYNDRISSACECAVFRLFAYVRTVDCYHREYSMANHTSTHSIDVNSFFEKKSACIRNREYFQVVICRLVGFCNQFSCDKTCG